MGTQFEWDPREAAVNIEKHKISFDEAETVFRDRMLITVIDEEHSIDEERYITFGMSAHDRLLLVAHTDREGHVRIISARKATRKEEHFYVIAD